MATLRAWLVHLYTASSAVIGLAAIVACTDLEFRLAIYLMLLTLVIDSTDGALARAAQVDRWIPWFNGRRLDDICDYFTYVIVPAFFMIQAGLLPNAFHAVQATVRNITYDALTTGYGLEWIHPFPDGFLVLLHQVSEERCTSAIDWTGVARQPG